MASFFNLIVLETLFNNDVVVAIFPSTPWEQHKDAWRHFHGYSPLAHPRPALRRRNRHFSIDIHRTQVSRVRRSM